MIQRFAALISISCLLSAAAHAQTASSPIPAPPSIAATSYLLMDYPTGRLLVSENPNQRSEPASITKLMTAYAVFKELKAGEIGLDDKVNVSEHAWRTGGSRMFIEVGTKVSVHDLLQGMIVQSGNDASVALAEYVAGSEDAFAGLMNQYAQQLGMKNSHFMNATGLPHEDHYTTAHDVAILARALIREFPDYYAWFAEKEFTYNGIRQHNRNTLLWRDPAVDGLKTGHTDTAGYCLTASAKRDGMRLISVVMGAKSEKERADDSQALLNYGFRFYETHQLYAAGDALKSFEVWKGGQDTVPAGLTESLEVTIPRGHYDDLEANMELASRIMAPVQKGERLGTLTVSLKGDVLARAPLVALEAVPLGGWWTRFKDGISLWFAGDE